MAGINSSEDSYENKQWEKLIYSEMERDSNNENFDDVFGVERTIEMLKDNIVLPFRLPILYVKPEKAFVLFGVPGSGKTYLMKAAANAARAKLLVFHLWNLKSNMLIGKDSSMVGKCMKYIFQVARENSPSILCFEDIDVLSDMDQEKEIFLIEMHNYLHNRFDERNLFIVVGTTQAPWKVDPLVRKKFNWSCSSHVNLPNEKARIDMLKSLCKDIPNSLCSGDFERLSSKIEGFSGSDIVVLVRSASMRPVRKISKATHFKKIYVKTVDHTVSEISEVGGNSNEKKYDFSSEKQHDSLEKETVYNKSHPFCCITLCEYELLNTSEKTCWVEKFVQAEESDDNAIAMSFIDIPENKIHVNNMMIEDFERELTKMKPSQTKEIYERMLQFESEFCT